MSMTVKIPVNTIATVNVPFEEGETVTLAEPASDAVLMEETLTINGKKAESFYLGSGEYHFTVKKGE